MSSSWSPLGLRVLTWTQMHNVLSALPIRTANGRSFGALISPNSGVAGSGPYNSQCVLACTLAHTDHSPVCLHALAPTALYFRLVVLTGYGRVRDHSLVRGTSGNERAMYASSEPRGIRPYSSLSSSVHRGTNKNRYLIPRWFRATIPSWPLGRSSDAPPRPSQKNLKEIYQGIRDWGFC